MHPHAPGRSHHRWVICALLFLATTINYVDRQILSLLKPMLDQQFGWTATQFGLINSAFQAAYAVSLFAFGWLIDARGTKIGYAVSIALWSVAALGHALVASIGGFFAARIALGLGEGGNFPAAVKATAQWFPARERSFATSLFLAGSNVGAIVAPMLVPPIADAFGWRWAFILAGLAGLLWIALWALLFDVPARSRHVAAGERALLAAGSTDPEEGRPPVPWRELLRHREAWSVIAARFLTDPVWWFFLIWLPDFFKHTRGLDIKHSWRLLASIYGLITVLSIVGGWVPGYLTGRGWTVTRARKTTMFVAALLALPLAGITWVGDWTAVLLIGLAGAAHQAWSANLYTTASDLFPRRAVARLTGVAGTAGSVGGIIFPVATGWLIDHFVDGYALVFGYCAGAYVLGFGVNHLLAPRFEPVALGEIGAGGNAR